MLKTRRETLTNFVFALRMRGGFLAVLSEL